MTIPAEDETKAEPLPSHETSASPVAVSVAAPRYFGVTPPTLLFGFTTATVAVAIVLAVLEHWVAAIVLAAIGLVEAALFLGVAGRKPDSAVARASATTLVRARERVGWLVESAGVRTDASRRLKATRGELFRLAEARERHLRALGLAVYEGDDDTANRLREELARLDEQTRVGQEQLTAIAELAQERLQEGRLRVRPTVVRHAGDEE
jgi:hypothetical protein